MKKVKLSVVCNILNGFAFQSDKYVSSGIRIIRIANVQKGYIEDKLPCFYPIESKEEYKKYQLYEDDLLISLTGNVGRVALMDKKFLPALLNQRVACLRIKDVAKVDKHYLFSVLNSDLFEDSCIRSAKGVAQKNMSTDWLKEFEITLPSLEEQKTIADKLDKVTALINKRKEQLAKLDTLVKSRFIELFGDYNLAHPQEDWKSISEIGKVVGGSTPKTNVDEYWDGEYRWITPAELEADSGYIYDSVRKLTKAGVDSCSLQELPVNTVILTSRAPIGKVAIAGSTFYCNQGFKNIVCTEEIVPRYLYTLLLLNTAYLNSLGRGATFKEISKSIVENIRIPVPTIEDQTIFATFVEQIDKSKLAIQQSLEQLETLKKSLMQQYFG